MKKYYNIDSEKVYTLEELKAIYDEAKEEASEYIEGTFAEYLNACMFYNNGSLDEYEVQYFDSIEDIEDFVNSFNGFGDDETHCAVFRINESTFIDENERKIYEVF